MIEGSLIRRHLIGLAATMAMVAPVFAGSAEIAIEDAKIAAGKLTISGTTSNPNMRLRLDGRDVAAFNTTSAFDRTFSISAVYLPRDCIVSVQRVLPSGALGAATEAVVANCAPAALSPRGAWSKASSYQLSDLVSHRGASWIATRESVSEEPGRNSSWQLFAAAGGTGEAGQAVAAGTAGASGAAGAAGASGGVAELAAPQAPAIPSGPAGGDLAGNYPNPKIASQVITTAKLADVAVTTAKLGNGAVTKEKIGAGAVNTVKILDGAVSATKLAADSVDGTKVVNDSLGSDDIAPLNGDLDIQDNTITTFDLATDSVDTDEVLDFGLSNQDVGVLFAQIAADGTVSNSSGSVTATKLSTGTYEVDFGRPISSCAFTATQGEAGIGSAAGAILGVTDRSGNANAVFLTTRTNANALADNAFQLVVVC